MFTTGLGLGLLGLGVVLEALGAFWISRIVEIQA
jgi:hypothetical protein